MLVYHNRLFVYLHMTFDLLDLSGSRTNLQRMAPNQAQARGRRECWARIKRRVAVVFAGFDAYKAAKQIVSRITIPICRYRLATFVVPRRLPRDQALFWCKMQC